MFASCFFFQAEDGIRDLVRSRGLGDVYKRQEGRESFAAARGVPDVAVAAVLVDAVHDLLDRVHLSLIHI